MKSACSIILITCLFFGLSLAQDTAKQDQRPTPIHYGVIKGRVYDAKSKGNIEGALVKIKNLPYGANTDTFGVFLIKGVPVGIYTLETAMSGYSKIHITNIKVLPEYSTIINIAMTDTVYMLGETTVTGKRVFIESDGMIKDKVKSNGSKKKINLLNIDRTSSISYWTEKDIKRIPQQ